MRTSLPNTMGVELEFSSSDGYSAIKRSLARSLERAGYDTPVVNWEDFDEEVPLDRYWYVKEDGSCATDETNGVEITSPPLSNRHFSEFTTVCRAAQGYGEVNQSCGTHVHHRFPSLSLPALHGVLATWRQFEPFLYRLVASSRRRNQFCAPLANTFSRPEDVYAMVRNAETLSSYSRYYTLNASHWWRTGRFEVRMHHGTLNANRIWNWAHLTQHVINAGAKITSPDLLPAIDYTAPIRTQAEAFRTFLASSTTPEELEFFDQLIMERLRLYNPTYRTELETV